MNGNLVVDVAAEVVGVETLGVVHITIVWSRPCTQSFSGVSPPRRREIGAQPGKCQVMKWLIHPPSTLVFPIQQVGVERASGRCTEGPVGVRLGYRPLWTQ
jgi:hypothetical protein